MFSLLLVLLALAALVAGLVTSDVRLVWLSIAASLLAALALALIVAARRRRNRPDPPPDTARSDARERVPAVSVARTLAAARRPALDPIPPVAAGEHASGPLAVRIAVALAGREPVPIAATRDRPIPLEPEDDTSGVSAGAPDLAADAELDPVAVAPPPDEPAEEGATLTDTLLVVDLDDEVLVVDARPRYHLFSCTHLAGREAIPLPLREAREDGFSPCGLCRPDTVVAGMLRERRRRARG